MCSKGFYALGPKTCHDLTWISAVWRYVLQASILDTSDFSSTSPFRLLPSFISVVDNPTLDRFAVSLTMDDLGLLCTVKAFETEKRIDKINRVERLMLVWELMSANCVVVDVQDYKVIGRSESNENLDYMKRCCNHQSVIKSWRPNQMQPTNVLLQSKNVRHARIRSHVNYWCQGRIP